MKTSTTIIGVIFIVAMICILSFGITSAILYGICWAFNFTFSWKLAIGIWLLLIILRSIFKTVVNVKEK